MMDWVVYVLVSALVVGDVIAAQVINKKRLALDLTTEAGRAQDKKLRLVITVILGYSVVLAGILLVLLKPYFA